MLILQSTDREGAVVFDRLHASRGLAFGVSGEIEVRLFGDLGGGVVPARFLRSHKRNCSASIILAGMSLISGR
jgi:hypothetical protein